MRTVHKFDMDGFARTVPPGTIIAFGPDRRGDICVWIDRDTEDPRAGQPLKIYGTGHEIADGDKHLMSCKHGHMIWHLYQVGGEHV